MKLLGVAIILIGAVIVALSFIADSLERDSGMRLVEIGAVTLGIGFLLYMVGG